MHSNKRCLRAVGRRQFVYLAHLIGFACFLLAGFNPTHVDAAQAGAMPQLRVLKLRHHEANHPHRDTAGEFQLLSDFARHHGMTVRWIDAVRPAELRERLQRGEGDVVIADLLPEPTSQDRLLSSVSMGSFAYTVYGRRDLNALDPAALAGLRIGITLASPLWPYFNALEDSLDDIQVVVLPDYSDRESILQGIAEGKYDAAVVTARRNEDPAAGMPGLKRLFELSGANSAVWHFTAQQHGLRDRIDSYLQRYHGARAAPQSAFGDLDEIERRHVVRVITRIDPQNYFLKHGRPAGFEYELVRSFAQSSGLAVEFLVADSDRQTLQWLRDGVGDLIATRVNAAAVRADPGLTQSRRYFHAAAVIVNRSNAARLNAATLAGKRIAVLANSVQHRALGELVTAGIAVEAIVLNPDTPPQALATLIEQGGADAAIVDAYAVAALRSVDPLIQAGASLATEFNYAWTLRAGDVRLGASVNDYLRTHYRTETYNVLARRYFGQPRFTRFSSGQPLSPYDDLVRRHAEAFDFDWRLIVAQMFQESRFDPAAVSSAGARGLMQLLPATAQSLGVDDAFDPESGIRGGVAYLDKLRKRFDRSISPRERTWFALGAYNIGFHRIERARREATAQGLDGNRWFGHVEKIMRDMASTDQSCRCGQTVVYVRGIRSLYGIYSRVHETLTSGLLHGRDGPTI